jgi:anthranilate phosphoribosyltransferase
MKMATQATQWLEQVLANDDLSEAQAAAAMRAMASGELDPALAGGLLIALRAKGEAAEEIRGFATAMRELARRPAIETNGDYVDIVGTGGDGSGSLNLSTGSALLAAAAGLAVVKHGNRSISSRCGSADVLAELGLPIPLDEQQAAKALDTLGFTFLFAPHYHPAMKNIGPVRAALGVRTVFNILGPLANPAQPAFHVLGAYSETMAERMAYTLAGMPGKRAFVIHGAPGWDEATPVGPFLCFDIRPGAVTRAVRDPRDVGIERCSVAALTGGEASENAQRLRAALEGGDSPAHRDALALGAGLALEVTGAAATLADGVSAARSAIEDGRAGALVARLSEVI